MEPFKNTLHLQKSNDLFLHLKDPSFAINASISTNEEERHNDASGMLNTLEVDYLMDAQSLSHLGHLNDGRGTYIISPLNESNKSSHGYINCIGIVVVGMDRGTGKNISFLTHQDTTYLYRHQRMFKPYNQQSVINQKHVEKMQEDFSSRMIEVRERCIDGTIDAVIFCGNYLSQDYMKIQNFFRLRYKTSVIETAKIANNILGFDPVVIIGPKNDFGQDNVIFDNDMRRLFISRTWNADNSSLKRQHHASLQSFSIRNLDTALSKLDD